MFRRGETVDPIIDQAIARGDGGIWLQEQVVNAAAAQRAHDAGLFSLMDRCIYKEWLRLMNG